MALGIDRYITADIFICKEAYEPRGICTENTCKPKELTVSDELTTEKVKVYVNGVLLSSTEAVTGRRVDIEPYLLPWSYGTFGLKVYLLAAGADPACMFAFPPCTDMPPMDTDIRWQRVGDSIYAELPLPEHCAVESFMTAYPDGTDRYTAPGHTGEADGVNVSLTFDDGGHVRHEAPLDEKWLIPGRPVGVFYKLRGYGEYHPLAVYRYETEMLTTVTVLGCGLVDYVKVYKNPLKPADGYSYEYLPAEGGEGYQLQDEWLYATRLRYLVDYLGEAYWVKPSDGYIYQPDDTAVLIKNIGAVTQAHASELSSDTLADGLEPDLCRIVPLQFYS